jgi:hypothetical protein
MREPSSDVTTCSFCLKPSDAVSKLIAGPGVFICNECVVLCGAIVANPPALAPTASSWEDDLDLERVLGSLPRMASVGAQAERNLARFVRKARDLGATWTVIGTSLGMTRQSAWERFSSGD